MRKLNRLMEHFWAAVAIATFLAALWALYQFGWQEGRQWLWFPMIAGAMFAFRRFTRRKLEAMEDREAGRSG
ncbi:MAG: hypothetical protein KDB88_11255 [Flavobacteriales bacterium]|nr:hypothetical protein [Flavobacteriales bacterium]